MGNTPGGRSLGFWRSVYEKALHYAGAAKTADRPYLAAGRRHFRKSHLTELDAADYSSNPVNIDGTNETSREQNEQGTNTSDL